MSVVRKFFGFSTGIIMPPIGLIFGKVNFADMYWNLSGGSYKSLAEAKAAGAAVMTYGAFINTVLDFLIVALVIFFVIKGINKMFVKPAAPAKAAAPTTKECPHCFTAIPIKATRCPNCTSELATRTK